MRRFFRFLGQFFCFFGRFFCVFGWHVYRQIPSVYGNGAFQFELHPGVVHLNCCFCGKRKLKDLTKRRRRR